MSTERLPACFEMCRRCVSEVNLNMNITYIVERRNKWRDSVDEVSILFAIENCDRHSLNKIARRHMVWLQLHAVIQLTRMKTAAASFENFFPPLKDRIVNRTIL